MVRFSSLFTHHCLAIAGLVVSAIAAAACGAPDAAATDPPTETTQVPTATVTRVAPTLTAAPTSTQEAAIYQDPTATPFAAPGDDPAFSPVIFFLIDPAGEPRQRVFPSGVEEVFAVWEYRNMRDGAIVRREWMRDDQVWLTLEEPWNFAKYGANGTFRDVSVYDHVDGLSSGTYALQLYIDGVPQFIKDSWPDDRGFLIKEPRATTEYPAPGGDGRVAIVRPPGTLLVKDCTDCEAEPVVTADELADVAWFPDGRHLVYQITDRSGQTYGFTTIGIRYQLWALDTAGGEPYAISELNEGLWRPVISPDGRTIAAMQGSGWCDAGDCDLSLVFVKLNAAFQRTDTIRLHGFDFGAHDPGSVSMFPIGQPDLPAPGTWQSPTVFKSALAQTLGDTLNGVYLLDLETLKAERVGDIGPSYEIPGG